MELDWIRFGKLESSRIANDSFIHNSILSVVRSGTYLNGPELRNFEDGLSHALGARFARGVGNGTDALYLALRATGCSRDSLVITAPNAGGYTSTAARMIGARVAFCDVQEKDLTLDVHKLEEVLNFYEKLSDKYVVATHLFGNSVDLIAVKELCDRFGAILIEDCAQSFGGKQNGNFLGTFGEAAAFSFYPTKNLGAAGDGGAVLTNNEIVADKVTMLREYGWLSRYHSKIPGGINSRMDEIQARILSILIKDIFNENFKRKEILNKFKSTILNENKMRFINSNRTDDVCHLAVLKFENERLRNMFRFSAKQSLIETTIHYPYLDYNQSGLSLDCEPFACKFAEDALTKICTIPLYPELTSSEIDRLLDLLRSFQRSIVDARRGDLN